MKRVKSDWRCRLNTTTLSDLMFVMLEGSSIDMFNPSRACELWAEAAQRRPDYERSKAATKKAGSTPGPSSDVNPPSQEDQEEAPDMVHLIEDLPFIPEDEDEDYSDDDDNDDEKDDQDQSSDTDSSPEDMDDEDDA